MLNLSTKYLSKFMMKPLEMLKYLFRSCSPELQEDVDPKLIKILIRPALQHVIPEINKFLIGEKPLEDLNNNWEDMRELAVRHHYEGMSQECFDLAMEGPRSKQEEIKNRCTSGTIIDNHVVRDHVSWVRDQSIYPSLQR
jgi:hypothetical protein